MRLKLFLMAAMLVVFCVSCAKASVAEPMLKREIHLLKSDDGDTRVILRFPLSLAFSEVLALRRQGVEISTPFLLTDDALRSRLNSDAVLDDYEGFSEFLLRDYTFRVNGKISEPFMAEYVIVDTTDPNVDTGRVGGRVGAGLLMTRSLLTICASEYPAQSDVSNTLIVMSFYLLDGAPWDEVTIDASTMALGIKGATFETVIVDHRGGAPRMQVVMGAQLTAVRVSPSLKARRQQGQELLREYGVWLLALMLGAGLLGVWRFRRR